jgi:hypothetical protein
MLEVSFKEYIINVLITNVFHLLHVTGAAEKLLIHLKVFEDLKQGDASKGAGIMGKPRYLCLTRKLSHWLFVIFFYQLHVMILTLFF